jgi:hypothetical protein
MPAAMTIEELEQFRVRDDLDVWVVPEFAQKHLGVAAPQQLVQALEASYPVVGAGQAIEPRAVQWVTGDNVALRYRGNVLKRGKMWLQRGDPATLGYRKYYYTGWQWNILPATADVAACPEVLPIADAYDTWAASVGAQPANHYIVTKYRDGEHNIGFHFDKPKDIAPSDNERGKSLITVVKIGTHARPFALRNLPSAENKSPAPFFNEVLEPGTAVIMTLEANLQTQHAVPAVAESGPSGSIVYRTIHRVVVPAQAARELRKRRRE